MLQQEVSYCAYSTYLTAYLREQVNDFIRDKLSSTDGVVPHWAEIIAGGCVSSSVIFVTKIKTRTGIIGRRFQRTRTRIIVIRKLKRN